MGDEGSNGKVCSEDRTNKKLSRSTSSASHSTAKSKRRSERSQGQRVEDDYPSNSDMSSKATKRKSDAPRRRGGSRRDQYQRERRRSDTDAEVVEKSTLERRSKSSLTKKANKASSKKSAATSSKRKESRRSSGPRTLEVCGEAEQYGTSLKEVDVAREAILRRPSLEHSGPMIGLCSSPSSVQPSLSSRQSEVSAILQFDPTKDANVVRRKQDVTAQYSVENVDGSKTHGSIGRLLESPDKQGRCLDGGTEQCSRFEKMKVHVKEDPFESFDAESKKPGDALNQSIMSMAVSLSTASSLSGFTDEEDAFSDFDPLEFPDSSQRPDDDDDDIIPDYLKENEQAAQRALRDVFDEDDEQTAQRALRDVFDEDDASLALDAAIRPSEEVVRSEPFLDHDIPTESETAKLSRSTPLHSEHIDLETSLQSLKKSRASRRNTAARALAASSASSIALMLHNDDSDHEDEDYEDDENVQLGESLRLNDDESFDCGMLLSAKPKQHRTSEPAAAGKADVRRHSNQGLRRSFSVRKLLRRSLSRASSMQDDSSDHTTGVSIRSLFQKKSRQHSLLQDDSDLFD